MTIELYKVYRPKTLKEVVGQPSAVAALNKLTKTGKIPHAILFSGPSGCGKTTLARIICDKLGCSDHDFHEINCADFRGIDMVRDIRQRMGLSPMGGKSRVWLIDEAHQLSKDAQNAFLKILEDTPKHAYFMLATTEPNKLLKTIHTRCTTIALKALPPKALTDLVQTVTKKEKAKLSEEVLDRIVEVSEGSARTALVILHKIIGLESEDEQLEAIETAIPSKQAIDIARRLLDKRTKWPEMASLLRQIDEEPETLRRMILGYCMAILLGKPNPLQSRASMLIEAFCDNVFDSGKPGLVARCYEVVASK